MAFTVPTLAAILARIKADFRSILGSDALFATVEYALVRALAGQSKGWYAYADYVKRQGFVDLADETNFWRWAAIWGIVQKAPTPWKGVYTFSGTNGTVVPAGTVLSRSDGWLYETDAEITLVGSTEDVAITAAADYEGSEGTNAAGQALTLASPIAGIDSEGEVASSTTDGTDLETQADGLVRLLQRIQTPPSGGGAGDYVRWALEVAGVTRAWETSAAAGEVEIAFVRDNDGSGAAILPDSGERAEVLEYVQSVAPITVVVSVATLTALTVNVTLSSLSPDTAPVRAAIEAELLDLFTREAEPGVPIPLSRISEAISSAAGETSHVMSSPSVDVTPTATQVPLFGTLSTPLDP